MELPTQGWHARARVRRIGDVVARLRPVGYLPTRPGDEGVLVFLYRLLEVQKDVVNDETGSRS